jgi:hypothetical protein
MVGTPVGLIVGVLLGFVVSFSDDNIDGVPAVAVVVVSICAMVGTSYAVVVGVMINIPLGTVVGMTIETSFCISYFIFYEKRMSESLNEHDWPDIDGPMA